LSRYSRHAEIGSGISQRAAAAVHRDPGVGWSKLQAASSKQQAASLTKRKKGL